MECAFGLIGNGFTLLAADANAGRSIIVYKRDMDKITELDSHKIMAYAGVYADGVAFSEFVQKNMKLYELEHDIKLSTPAAAHFVRGELATALRRGPFQTNVLVGGFDADSGAHLFFCDYLGTLQPVTFGAHGYASNFILSIFDREYRPDMSLEDALTLLRACVKELHTRFMVSMPEFKLKIVDAAGVRTITL